MDLSTEDIGALLKERREQLGYSLQDAADRTRIRKTYLESIEANRLADLPGKTYVTGFVGVYSRFLGLDSKAILASLSDDTQAEIKSDGEVLSTKKPDTQFIQTSTKGGWGTFVLVFVVVLIVGGGLFYLPSMNKEDNAIVVPAEKPVAEQIKPYLEAATASEKPVIEEAAPVVQEEPEAVEEIVATQVEEPTRDPLPSISAAGSSLRMLALADGSLIIKADQRKPHEYKLHDGLDLTWKIKSEVSVEMNIGDVARFWLDGTELDVAGQKSFLLQSAP